MAFTSWLQPASFVMGDSGVVWLNPNNALGEDGQFATQTLPNGNAKTSLRGTLPSAGLPANAIITGIEVSLKGYASTDGTKIVIQMGGGGLTTFYGLDSSYVATLAFQTDSNAIQLIGSPTTFPTAATTQLTPAIWNSGAVTFYFYHSASSTYPVTLSVDDIKVRVHYDLPVTDGPKAASSAVNTGGTIGWANPNNAISSDNLRTTLSFTGSASTTVANFGYLDVTDFGFNIPSGVTIASIDANIEMVRTGGTTGEARTNTVQLLKAGVRTGTNKSVATNVSTVESVRSHGGDLWGTTWTPAQINASNFGVSIRAVGSTATTNRVLEVDQVTITVNWVPVPRALKFANDATTSSNYALSFADTNFSNVASLLHFDGANGSSSFPDVQGRIWTAHGGAVVSSSSPFAGSGSGYLPDSSAYIDTTDTAGLKLGAGDFTVEVTIDSISALGVGDYQVVLNGIDGSGGSDFQLYTINATGGVGWSCGNNSVYAEGGSGALNAGWHHICVMRKGTTLYGFVDGVYAFDVTETNNYNHAPSAFTIGNQQGAYSFTGGIDELRITPGIARYPTTGFSSPVGPHAEGSLAPIDPVLLYQNTGASNSNYVLTARSALSSLVSATSTANYLLTSRTALPYTNTSITTENYALKIKLGLSYSNVGAAASNYAVTSTASLLFVNAESSASIYSITAVSALTYAVNATSASNYAIGGAFSYSSNTATTASYGPLVGKILLTSTTASASTSSYGPLVGRTLLTYTGSTTSGSSYALSSRSALEFNIQASSNSVYAMRANAAFGYSSESASDQNYSLSLGSTFSYNNFGVSAANYGPIVGVTSLSYTNTPSSASNYVAKFFKAFGFTNLGSSSSNYAVDSRAQLSVSIAGGPANSYALSSLTSLEYTASTRGTLTYSLTARTSLAYQSVVQSQSSYEANFKGIFSMSNSAASASSYALRAATGLAHTSTITTKSAYALAAAVAIVWGNTAASTDVYTADFFFDVSYNSIASVLSEYTLAAGTELTYSSSCVSDQRVEMVFGFALADASNVGSVQEYQITLTVDFDLVAKMLVKVEWDEWATVGDVQMLVHRTALNSVQLNQSAALVIPNDPVIALTVPDEAF